MCRMPTPFSRNRQVRIAAGGILHETHTFTPSLTDLDAFRQMGITRGHEILKHRASPTAIGGILDGLEAAGCQAVPLMYASAMPSGTVSAAAYQSLRSEFLEALKGAIPVDGVALALHGAMVAENQLDCEGDLLAEVRTLVGPGCPLVATLDKTYGISIQGTDIVPENFKNLETIGALLRQCGVQA